MMILSDESVVIVAWGSASNLADTYNVKARHLLLQRPVRRPRLMVVTTMLYSEYMFAMRCDNSDEAA
jgi:hypothetical protein